VPHRPRKETFPERKNLPKHNSHPVHARRGGGETREKLIFGDEVYKPAGTSTSQEWASESKEHSDSAVFPRGKITLLAERRSLSQTSLMQGCGEGKHGKRGTSDNQVTDEKEKARGTADEDTWWLAKSGDRNTTGRKRPLFSSGTGKLVPDGEA